MLSEIGRQSVPQAWTEKCADSGAETSWRCTRLSDTRHLLGMKISRSALSLPPDVQITIRDLEKFAAVKRDRDPLPLYVRGVLSTPRSEPVSVAVVVNGIIVAVCQSYRERDAHVFGTLIPEESLRDGDNTVDALVVDALP